MKATPLDAVRALRAKAAKELRVHEAQLRYATKAILRAQARLEGIDVVLAAFERGSDL